MAILRPSPEKKSSKQTSQTRKISDDERRRMIAEAAYLRAKQRGFVGGDPVTDWLAAEAEINERLSKRTDTSPTQPRQTA